MSWGDDIEPPPVPEPPRARVLRALAVLGADELEVIALLSERLVAGRAVYGELQISADRRDFRHEALLELVDGCVYLAAATFRARRPSEAREPVRFTPDEREPVGEPAPQRGGW